MPSLFLEPQRLGALTAPERRVRRRSAFLRGFGSVLDVGGTRRPRLVGRGGAAPAPLFSAWAALALRLRAALAQVDERR